MHDMNLNPDDAKLRGLLRESRATPPLPPRFQEGVWRRIEGTGTAATTVFPSIWLDRVVAWVQRPRLAFVLAMALVFAGALLGAREGVHAARQDSQARYLAAVAPNPLR